MMQHVYGTIGNQDDKSNAGRPLLPGGIKQNIERLDKCLVTKVFHQHM